MAEKHYSNRHKQYLDYCFYATKQTLTYITFGPHTLCLHITMICNICNCDWWGNIDYWRSTSLIEALFAALQWELTLSGLIIVMGYQHSTCLLIVFTLHWIHSIWNCDWWGNIAYFTWHLHHRWTLCCTCLCCYV